MKSLTMQFSSSPCHFLPPRPTYHPQHPVAIPFTLFDRPKQHNTTQHITVFQILNNSSSAYYNVTIFSSSHSYIARLSELLTTSAGCPSLIFTAGPNQKEGYRADSQLIYRSPIPIY